MLCAPELVFGGAKCVGSRFHGLRPRTRFRRYRGRRVLFSCCALPNSFSMVSRSSRPVFMFSATRHIFGGIEDVGSCFHVLSSRTHFRWCRMRPVPFSCFARPDSFSAVARASVPVFMFCAPGHVLGGSEYVRSRFHILRIQNHFRRYRGRRVPFSSFVLPDSFSAVPSASSLVFKFCAAGLIFDEPTGSGPVFMFWALGLIFDGTEGVGSRFHVLRPRTHFRRYRGHRVPFSCFALPDSFSAVPRSSGSFFMSCAPGLVFSGAESVGSRFHGLRSRTHFRRYLGRRVLFSCFERPYSFSAVPRASSPVLMFCTPGLLFGGTEGVWCLFHVLRTRTHFWRYQGR
jgi:hypothetical protein